MELFILMDCVVGLRPFSLDMRIHIVSPESAIWLCTALISHLLLISDSRVLVFQVSSMNTCVLPRGDGIGMVLLVLRTQHRIEVQSEKVQATARQSVWAIAPHHVIKPRVILAGEAGATVCVLLEGDGTPVLLPSLAGLSCFMVFCYKHISWIHFHKIST